MTIDLFVSYPRLEDLSPKSRFEITSLTDFFKPQHHLRPFASFRPEGEIFKEKYSFQDAVLTRIIHIANKKSYISYCKLNNL